jgi:hypothetical protein
MNSISCLRASLSSNQELGSVPFLIRNFFRLVSLDNMVDPSDSFIGLPVKNGPESS